MDATAVEVVTRIIGTHPTYNDLLEELGLSQLRTLATADMVDVAPTSTRTAPEMTPDAELNGHHDGRHCMTTPPHDPVNAAMRGLDFADMDPALLTLAILSEVRALRIGTDMLRSTMEVAAYVHRTHKPRPGSDARPPEPYIAHPLRNTLRLIRYGCLDEATLAAAVLHDTVEDHPVELSELFGGERPSKVDAIELQSLALSHLSARFGPEVAGIVKAVTNPPRPAGLSADEKNLTYAQHVASVIRDPKVFLVKFSDYVDNAGSVHHISDEGTRGRLSRKYAPLVEVFRRALGATTAPLPVSEDGNLRIHEQLDRIGARIS